MAEKKETTQNGAVKLLDAVFEAGDKKKESEKQAYESIQNQQLEYQANKLKTQATKKENQRIALVDHLTSRIKAIEEFEAKYYELRRDYYSLSTKEEKSNYVELLYKRNQLIAQSISDINFKLRNLDTDYQGQLAISQIKAETQDERNYIDYLKELQKINNKYVNEATEIDEKLIQDHLQKAQGVFYRNRDGSIDFNMGKTFDKSALKLFGDSIEHTWLGLKIAGQRLIGDEEGSKFTSHLLEKNRANHGEAVSKDLLDNWTWTDGSQWLKLLGSTHRLFADSAGEIAFLAGTSALVSVGLAVSGVGGVAGGLTAGALAGQRIAKVMKSFEKLIKLQ